MRLLFAFTALLTLAACDSNDVADTSSFARLQGGTWERTDAGATDESVVFGPRQAYVYYEGNAVVDRGDYFTRSSAVSDDVFVVAYLSGRVEGRRGLVRRRAYADRRRLGRDADLPARLSPPVPPRRRTRGARAAGPHAGRGPSSQPDWGRFVSRGPRPRRNLALALAS